MEKLLAFVSTIVACTLSVVFGYPALFLISFIGGILYSVIRGKQKGWSLPKDVKDTHSW